MSKKRQDTTEPELSAAAKWRSLRHLSIFGAGLVGDLESRCTDREIEIERFNPDGAPMVRDGDLSTLLGDQAESIRASLDADDYVSIAIAAGLAGIDPLAVESLAKLRGVPVCYVTGETQVHRIAWDNLVNLLAHERSEHDGRDFERGRYSWGLMNRLEVSALKAALPGFRFSDPWYIPKPKPPLSAFQKALNVIVGESRPGREPTVIFDEDAERRAFADAIGVRWDSNTKTRGNRTVFNLYDLDRLTSYNVEEAQMSGNAQILESLFRGATRRAYASVFPNADLSERAMVRAELDSRIRQADLVGI